MGEMRFGPVARGLLSYVPALNDLLPSKTGGHTDSARYCYGVWMKHLTLLRANGFPAIPQTIAELGPGESLGVGLCALSGPSLCRTRCARSLLSATSLVLNELIKRSEEGTQPGKGWPNSVRT
jgi:hypothetical protein